MTEEKRIELIVTLVTELVGPIRPVGETHTDCKRLSNTQVLCMVTNDLIKILDELHYRYKDSPYGSVKGISNWVDDFLTNKIGIPKEQD